MGHRDDAFLGSPSQREGKRAITVLKIVYFGILGNLPWNLPWPIYLGNLPPVVFSSVGCRFGRDLSQRLHIQVVNTPNCNLWKFDMIEIKSVVKGTIFVSISVSRINKALFFRRKVKRTGIESQRKVKKTSRTSRTSRFFYVQIRDFVGFDQVFIRTLMSLTFS